MNGDVPKYHIRLDALCPSAIDEEQSAAALEGLAHQIDIIGQRADLAKLCNY